MSPSGGVGERLTLRVMLVGPADLGQLDKLVVTIRDDHFRRRDEKLIAQTPSAPNLEAIQRQVWGPYRLQPQVGPDEARADITGRETVYDRPIPVGEGLPFPLEPTTPPPYATATTHDRWQRERGTVIRLTLDASKEVRVWKLPCEIDVAEVHNGPVRVTVPEPGSWR
jgi:hypothetical protein